MGLGHSSYRVCTAGLGGNATLAETCADDEVAPSKAVIRTLAPGLSSTVPDSVFAN